MEPICYVLVIIGAATVSWAFMEVLGVLER